MERIVIKVGSSSIAYNNGLSKGVIADLVGQITAVRKTGVEVVVVSSGAIAAGKKAVSDFSGTIVDKQSAAVFGQPTIAGCWIEEFNRLGVKAGAAVYKDEDLLYAKTPLLRALKEGIVIVNGNDVVYDAQSEKEIISRDNDKLARFVAVAIGANRLIMLTGAEGVLDSSGQIIPYISKIEDLSQIALFDKTELGTGGMESKLMEARGFITDASKIAHIAGAGIKDVIIRIMRGERIGTRVTLPLQGYFLMG